MARTKLLTALHVGTAFAALGAAFPAQAQIAPAPSPGESLEVPDAEEATDLGGEIIVTARRREETLVEVPIAITAISGEALAAQGALDITEVGDQAPNVTLEPSRGTNTTLTAFIRGVGQQDPVPGFEAGVGLYLDDVYLNRPQAAVLDIYDVERIEVLRGPQGTLYGRNTIGGAIKYVTRRLRDEPSLRIRGAIGTYEQADLIVSASTPVTDMVKVGASGARLSRGGFGENLTTGRENYNRDVWAFRGTVELEPSPTTFFRLSGDVAKDESEPRGGHRLIPGIVSGAPVLDNEFDTRGGLLLPKQDIEAYGVAGHGEAELSDAFTVRSITAFRKDRSRTPIDFDALPAADVDVPAIYRNRQFSQELQLLYDQGPLAGLVGAYYLDASAFALFDVVLATTGTILNLPGLTASTLGDVDTRSWSVFGDFTYDLTEQLSLSLGGRYTSDKRSSLVFRRNLLGGASPELGGNGTQLNVTSNFEGEKTFKKFTPRASVSFQPTEDHNLYLSYSKGFKGGGFDPRGLSGAAPDTDGNGTRDADEVFDFFLFSPETVDSYEAGWKASLLGNRLNFALAAFYADYKDVQIPGSVGFDSNGDGVNDTFVGVTTNAAAATFKGVEFEGNAVLARDLGSPGSRLGINWALGYIDAQYDRYINAVGQDVADLRRVQNTPKWTASTTLTYGVPVGAGRLDALTSLSYRSGSSQFEIPNEFLDQDGYALWDASLVWNDDADRYSLGLHAKNILDTRYKTSGYTFVAQNQDGSFPTRPNGALIPTLGREGTLTAYYGNPRQVFLTFGVNF